MKKLKLVEQLDHWGCGIACLAMITRKSYFEIRNILHLKLPRMQRGPYEPIGIGLRCEETKEILEKIFNIPCEFIKFISLNELKKHCILVVSPLCGHHAGGSHGIIFDAKKNCILDPSDQLCKISNLNKHNVICCLEIQ